ncbi:fucose 4-O-acetylase-like acetyltransferase [Rathayibacter sp. PhB151]|uniref:acyltransferase family protein n=1 Tax=Rathayibacter sp. PhB151 TaxID=2485189 RepID=UPI001062FBA2|nr:acyltransferase [Rathayibacter sp. PhB151]TDX78318.1 fucose 4-O-acetylase-like acetyltransferase [Rathayibacter sp. PhB151]
MISAPRSVSIDVVRILGIVAVVACHVWTAPDWSRRALFTWNVPLFFFLSGYLWTRWRPLRVEAHKRLLTLAVPYLAWLAILLPVWLVQQIVIGDLELEDIWRPIAGGNFVGRPFSILWFVSALLFVALFYRVLQGLPLKAHWVIAVTLLLAAGVAPKAFSLLPLGIGTGLAGLVFVVAGTTFAHYRQSIRAEFVIAVSALSGAVALISTGVSAPLDLKRADVGTPLLSAAVAIAISAALIVLAERIVRLFGDLSGRVIVFLSSGGLFVVFAHPVVLWALSTPPNGTAFDFLLALVIPWVVGSGIRFTRLSPLLIGAPQAQRQKMIAD